MNGDYDLLELSKVSGFYGPGNWSGWFLTIVTSYISIIRNPDSTRVHDVLLHLLGTNWAAIDLLRQVSSYEILGKMKDSSTEIAGLEEAIAAPINISTWGIIHALLQFFLSLTLASDPRRQILPYRASVLLAGTFIPSMSLTHCILSPDKTTSSEWTTFTPKLPVFYWNNITPLIHGIILFLISFIGIWTCVFVLIASGVAVRLYLFNLTDTSIGPSSRQPKSYRWVYGVVGCAFMVSYPIYMIKLHSPPIELTQLGDFLRMAALISFALLLFLIPVFSAHIFAFTMSRFVSKVSFSILIGTGGSMCAFLSFAYLVRVIGSGGKIVGKSCYYMPCAPQSIADWDQAFGLMVGLVMLVIEAVASLKPFREWVKNWWSRR